MQTLAIKRPDDMHLHLRDGSGLHDVLADSARQFARAIIMPNLDPPIVSTQQALAYRQRIVENLPEHIRQGNGFEPLMTLYLTEAMTTEVIHAASQSPYIHAVKYYPAGATTNAMHGVANIEQVYPLLAVMSECDMPLLVHGEVTDPEIDVFDREKVFIERILSKLMQEFPQLRIVFEHITTKDAVDFVNSASDKLAATITPQHILMNRNELFSGGLRPHHYCLPVLKSEVHRQAVFEAAISGNKKFFLGTDSAPHAQEKKESACGCAGIYSACCAIELYAEVFHNAGCLDRLEGFASCYGADFYGLAKNTGVLTLVQKSWQIPKSRSFGDAVVIPFYAGQQCAWSLQV